MTVLIVTRSDDNVCVSNVMEAIKHQGGSAFRFDTDRFPTEVRLSVCYEQGSEFQSLICDNVRLDLREVTSVWYRRMNVANRLPAEMDSRYRWVAQRGSRAIVLGLIADLEVFQLDALAHVRWAENKQLQLRLARNMGLDIPRTLITNDPEAVKEFAASCPQGLITKMSVSFAIYEDGQAKGVYTNALRDEHLQALEGLQYCPMIFQERVPKTLELRITIVGDRVFAAAVDSQASSRARHDWRREGLALMEAWQPYTLPAAVEARLLKLMDAAGLNYSAIDMILTPDERHVFLELNPAGEFCWLEERTPRLPISSALAKVLLGRARQRYAPTAGLTPC